MSKITNVAANFRVDSIRLMLDSVMQELSSQVFCATSNNDPSSASETIQESNLFKLYTGTTATGGFATAFSELTYSVVGGRLEIDGLTTSNLPANRLYWSSFGQLFEDVFLGRIPELSNAVLLIVDQPNQQIFWANSAEVADVATSGTVQLEGEDDSQSEDFFEG